MKTFKEYLAESKKVYSFKVKVAGDIPEKFQENLKSQLDRCGVMTFEKVGTTPVQAVPLDFPELTNCEVTTFEVVCEYPVTSPELVEEIKQLGLTETSFRVRGSGEPTEQEQVLLQDEMDNKSKGEALLNDSQYKETANVKHKDYFGDDFNKSFLKDLEKAAKMRKKDGTDSEVKLPKTKQDKAGTKSAIGGK